jgi:2-keto-4-pentenoate hydratase/2-oxohepta-3-ene-1,7-dioic acid hydratase in catechol pathway
MTVERFIRFVDGTGKVIYGEPSVAQLSDRLEGIEVEVLSGDPYTGLSRTGTKATVSKLLCPIESTPIIECVGLNYAQHAKEANLTIPSYPVVFTKPADALAGPYDDIPIHPTTTSQLDYEGELTVIIAKDGKNITESEALSYILGYTVGNDVSARNFQLPVSVSGGQFGYAKSFDKFAPIGPAVTLASALPDPQTLKYTTKVNGEKRQETGTDDMIFSVKKIVEHLSRGTTLRKGTVIMTGTPSGVGLFMEPKGFLKNGDVVEIEVGGIGKIANKIVFE